MKSFVKVLPATNGDCLLISLLTEEKEMNILIDGGRGRACYRRLKSEIENISMEGKLIDLLVITHTDDDHISGIIKLFQDTKINKNIFKNIWFNSGSIISNYFSLEEDDSKIIPLQPDNKKMSIRQGLSLEKELKKTNSWYENVLVSGNQEDINGMCFTILSPDIDTLREFLDKWEIECDTNTKMSSVTDYHINIETLIKNKFIEDKRLPNKSSIAFLLEFNGIRLLMLGDSHPSIVVNSLRSLGYSNKNKLKVNLMKVSHHGSKFNTSVELLNLIECKNFIVSTDGSKHGFPHKECLAKIVKNTAGKVRFYFNYSTVSNIFTEEEIEDYGMECIFLDTKKDYTVEVKQE